MRALEQRAQRIGDERTAAERRPEIAAWLGEGTRRAYLRVREMVPPLLTDRYLEAANLADKRNQPAVALPHGDKRKLEVAIMMALEPHVFMFDEPTAGMSVDDVPVILDLIKGLKTAGTNTILLVEHKMDVVKSLADRIVVLHNGRLVADGEPAEVIGSAIVQEAYLGVAHKEPADG